MQRARTSNQSRTVAGTDAEARETNPVKSAANGEKLANKYQENAATNSMKNSRNQPPNNGQDNSKTGALNTRSSS